MIIFDGKIHAQKLEQKIQARLSDKPTGKILCLILIGDDGPSKSFINMKKKLCERLKILCRVVQIDKNLTDKEISDEVRRNCSDPEVSGVVIQLPLPRESLQELLNLIPEEKDVDLISPRSLKKYYSGDFSKLPPVVRAFKYFLDENKLEVKNYDTIVVGKGFLVGEPLGYFLLQQGAKVQFILDYKTNFPLNCHLLVLSAGSPRLVKGESVSSGCNVVDFGSSLVDNKTIGDFDLNSAMGHLGIVSPSPGGMGPLVTRFLVMNLLGL